jgi:hypothetical protein
MRNPNVSKGFPSIALREFGFPLDLGTQNGD